MVDGREHIRQPVFIHRFKYLIQYQQVKSFVTITVHIYKFVHCKDISQIDTSLFSFAQFSEWTRINTVTDDGDWDFVSQFSCFQYRIAGKFNPYVAADAFQKLIRNLAESFDLGVGQIGLELYKTLSLFF